MTYQADKYEDIRRRQEEIAAERNLALTGSTIIQHDAATGETLEYKGEYAVGWTLTATDYDPA